MGLALGPGERAAIDGHVRLLLAWASAINLTSIREPAEVARLHVLDSLVALPVLRARDIGELLDLGSGGGFPGLPLAVALPAGRALLVDSVGKKANFLRTVVVATGLTDKVAVVARRAEAVAHGDRDRERWPAVTARAVGSLSELVEVGLPLVAPGGVLVAWKQGEVEVEVEAAAPALDALRAGSVEVIPAGLPGLERHRLVVVAHGGRIDARYPREPAQRRRQPLRAGRC